MAGQPTTRLHVSGYRFLLRRMEHALLRGDIRMLDDPMRTQSLSFIAGCVLAVLIVAVCTILAFLKPNAGLGDAAIVMSRESGALYVRIGDTLHPVLNLASARLATGNGDRPRNVEAADIDRARRGPLLGIPGAPSVIGQPLSSRESAWTVCDDESTTVIAGAPDLDRHDRQPSVLVTARTGSAAETYLLYDGRRAQVDLRNPGVLWALRLDGVQPRPVSRALLDAIPEVAPIAAPQLPSAGAPGAVAGLRVGTVVRVLRVDGDDYFVVLADGVQRIGEVAANLIRTTDPRSGREIVSIAPDAIGDVPVVDSLPVSGFPARAGMIVGAVDSGVICAQSVPHRPETVLWSGDSLPVESSPVDLAQGDGQGPNIDRVALPSGRSAYVRSAGLTGEGGDAGPLYLITDGGVLFGLRDESIAKLLGIEGEPLAAPWPVLSRLPRGPELSREGALVAKDSLALPP